MSVAVVVCDALCRVADFVDELRVNRTGRTSDEWVVETAEVLELLIME